MAHSDFMKCTVTISKYVLSEFHVHPKYKILLVILLTLWDFLKSHAAESLLLNFISRNINTKNIAVHRFQNHQEYPISNIYEHPYSLLLLHLGDREKLLYETSLEKIKKTINLNTNFHKVLVMDLQGKKAKHINIQISTESNDGCNLGTYRFGLFWRNESCTVPVSLLPLKNLTLALLT
ncbi:hypothetical protein NC652_027738 [Populus alba x Populus x berolinensis]|nr:hypothetical protein NC652_027738 [Populus alba x Populus x berolinensis]